MKRLILLFCSFSVSSFSASAQDNCGVFDGIDNYISFGDVLDLGISDFTIEAWFNSTTSGGIGQKIVNKGLSSLGTPTNAGYGFRIFDQAIAEDLDFSVTDGLGNFTRLLYDGVTINEWHHVAATRRGLELKLYYDGVLVDSITTNEIFNLDTNLPFGIGAIDKMGLSPTEEFMNGKIDEVRIWNVERSLANIVANMDCAITSPEPNLLAVWNLNEGSGLLASDNGGSNINGALQGGTAWTSSTEALLCMNTIFENELSSIIVYPNPFSEVLSIKGTPENATFNLYSPLGQLIATGDLVTSEIKLPVLEIGTYTLEVIVNTSTQRFNLIKTE